MLENILFVKDLKNFRNALGWIQGKDKLMGFLWPFLHAIITNEDINHQYKLDQIYKGRSKELYYLVNFIFIYIFMYL